MAGAEPVLRILYSADYELFLGENFLPERDVLLEPTRALLDACDRLSIPMAFFCDVTCLWRYRDDGDEEFPSAAEEQLREIVRRGHDVQAHLHPHWLTARREDRRWVAPMEAFLIGDLTRESAAALLARASSYLTELLRPVDPEYECVAFRAGNYGLQPNVEDVFGALRETGYLVDSSVVPGLVLQNAVNRIDFRGWPERDGQLHGVYEVPIASAPSGPLDAVRRRLRRRRLQPQEPRGSTMQAATGSETSLRDRLFLVDFLELTTDVKRLRTVTQRYVARVGGKATFSFSCHPKALGEAELEALVEYHRWLTGAYDVRALTFRQLAIEEGLLPAREVGHTGELEAGR
jgi:hypothetical protein